MLSTALQNSGLQKNSEYEEQVHVTDDDGNRFILDVVVHLPDKRDTIIDSKVSLKAYEQYCSAQSEEERIKALSEHLASIRNHIRLLSSKNYHTEREIHSLSHVLLFVAVEPAFLVALREDRELFFGGISKKHHFGMPLNTVSNPQDNS